MDKYLLEILKEVKTIIIPGLGALTITDESSGEIMFMPYLKHDDGQLSAYIAEKEGMDENDAKNLIAKYVREINAELDKGEEYKMYLFGSFVKGEDGEISFVNWPDAHTEEPINEPIEYTTEEVEEEVKNEESTTPIVAEENLVEEKVDEVENENEIESQEEIIVEPIEEEIVEEEEVDEDDVTPIYTTEKELNIEEKEELQKNEAKLDQLRQQQEAKKDKKRRGVGFYLLLISILIIVGGGTFFALNYNSLKQHIPFLADNTAEVDSESNELDKMKEIMGLEEENNEGADEEMENVESPEEENIEELIEEESQPIEEEETPVIEESQVQSTDLTKPYHIIVGAFGNPENAERLGEKLKSEGYNVKVGPGKGMTLVSIGSYATRAEAQSAISSFNEVATNAWVYKWQ